MTTIDTLGTFNDAVGQAYPPARELSRALRKLIEDILPEAYEVPWPKLKIVGYGIGPQKSTEHFCYIAPYGSHVNLGFNHGIALHDPSGLLEGAGKSFRHVKIVEMADVQDPALRSLLRAAVLERRKAVAHTGRAGKNHPAKIGKSRTTR